MSRSPFASRSSTESRREGAKTPGPLSGNRDPERRSLGLIRPFAWISGVLSLLCVLSLFSLPQAAGSPQGKAPILPLPVADLYFHYDDDFLTAYDRALLRELLPFLKAHPEVRVLLYAHADIRGTKEYNYALAGSRGDAVKQFLVVRGINPARIAVLPLGVDPIPHLPLCTRKEKSCYHLHRIVHLVEYVPPPRPLPPATVRKAPPPPLVLTANPPSAPKGISLLLPAGKLLVENTFMYVHNAATQVGVQSFTVNQLLPTTLVNIQQLSQDYYIDILSFYLGLTSRLELEADVPYIYRTLDAFVSPISTTGSSATPTAAAASGNGLGDVQFGLHYQFNTHPALGGLFLGNLMVKSTSGTSPFSIPVNQGTGVLTSQPTGTGFWAFEPGVSVFFPTSPVVFYGNGSYIYNMSRNFGGTVGTVNPGNATDFNFGGWFSFNPKASFSLGYDQMTIWPPSQNGTQIPLTRILQMGSVLFGTSYSVSPHFFYLVTVAAGVTPDAPNVQIMLRMPLFY